MLSASGPKQPSDNIKTDSEIEMKITILNLHSLKYAVAAALLSAGAVSAQSLDTPSFRGQAGTASAYWNYTFTNAVGGANVATSVAPGGLMLANAAITETATSSPSSNNPMLDAGGIYGFFTIASYTVSYSDTGANFPDGIGNVTFQYYGSTFDPTSALLTYASTTMAPTSYTLFASDGGGDTYEYSWNLPLSADVTSFNITFNASGPHSYLQAGALDLSPANITPTPEPGTWALTGLGLGLAGIYRFRRQSLK
jgi:hypothetical protein